MTRESGKQRAVTFRWACNMRLRQALVTLTDTTRHTHPWARAVYQQARDRGCEHAHAIRLLARAWCRVRWTCWQLTLLRHVLRMPDGSVRRGAWHAGQRGSHRAMALAIANRMVAKLSAK